VALLPLEFGQGDGSTPKMGSTNMLRNVMKIQLKSSVFWDIMPCAPLKLNCCSEEHIAFIFRVAE
jgi:hypothetical protein